MQTGQKATGKITTKDRPYTICCFRNSFYQLPQGYAGAAHSALKLWIARFPKQKEAPPQNWWFLRAAINSPGRASRMVGIVDHDSPSQSVGAGEEHSPHGTACTPTILDFSFSQPREKGLLSPALRFHLFSRGHLSLYAHHIEGPPRTYSWMPNTVPPLCFCIKSIFSSFDNFGNSHINNAVLQNQISHLLISSLHLCKNFYFF